MLTMVSWLRIALGLTSAVGQSTWCGPGGVQLRMVPDSLVLPFPEGSNQVLTVEVAGEPRSVWLATHSQAQLRALLTPVAFRVYQTNLASREVSAVLLTDAREGQFQIFAEGPDGSVVASVPIAFRVGQGEPTSAQPVIHWVDRGGTRQPLQPRFFGQAPWLAPEDVEVLELVFPAEAGPCTGRLLVGDRGWAMERVAPGLLRCRLAPAVRLHWHLRHTLAVQYTADPERGWRLAAQIGAVPKRLQLRGGEAALRVRQRDATEIPGSGGFWRVQLGDITMGQAFLFVVNAHQQNVIDPSIVRAGETLRFTLGDQRYVLAVNRLANLLVGEDYADLTIAVDRMWDRQAIERLLDLMESRTDVIFVREDRDYSGREAAVHLRRKLEAAGDQVTTLDDFIDKIASRSSMTHRAYRIRQPDGSTLDAAEWMRTQTRHLVAERRPVTEK